MVKEFEFSAPYFAFYSCLTLILGGLLALLLIPVSMIFPLCHHMLKALMLPTFGMMALGLSGVFLSVALASIQDKMVKPA